MEGTSPESVIREGEQQVEAEIRPEVEDALLNDVRERVFKIWEEEGALKLKEDDHGRRVVQLLDEGIIKDRGAMTRFRDIGGWRLARSNTWGKDNAQAMFWLFEGVPVEHQGQLKNMFYVPRNEAQAYDVEAIRRNSEMAVMGFWEALAGSRGVNKGDLRYPTVEDGFESKLDYVQASIAAAVWGTGEGYRLADKLMVKVKGEYEEITGRWIGEQLGMRVGKKGADWRDAPGEAIELAGEELYSRGLLLPEDFRQLSKERKRVNTNGMVWLTTEDGLGRRFTLGREVGGMTVDRIDGNRFVIYEGNVVRKFIDITQVETGVVRAYEGVKPLIDVPKGEVREEDLEKKVTIEVPGERIEIETREALAWLLEAREWLSGHGLDKDVWNDLSFQHQMELAITATKLIVKGESEENVAGLIMAQVEAAGEMSVLMNEFAGRLKKTNRDERIRLLFNRIESGYRTKTMELLMMALEEDGEGVDEGAVERLRVASRMVEVVRSIVLDGGEFRQDSVHFNYSEKGGNRITSVGLIFVNGNGEKIKLSIRPKQVEERRSDGTISYPEASFRVTYLDRENEKLGLRIDLGNLEGRGGRVSMDWDILKEFGLPHHYEEGFEAGMSNPAVFEDAMLFWANVFGVDELMAAEGAERGRVLSWK